MDERSGVRPPLPGDDSTIYEGTIAVSVSDDGMVEVTETITGQKYQCRNRTGVAISVTTPRRVWFFWNKTFQQWHIFGYVC